MIESMHSILSLPFISNSEGLIKQEIPPEDSRPFSFAISVKCLAISVYKIVLMIISLNFLYSSLLKFTRMLY